MKDFNLFFQKFKTLRKFDILTKFEDNWTTRTSVSIGEVILPPIPEYEVKIPPPPPPPKNRVNKEIAASQSIHRKYPSIHNGIIM